MGEAEILATKGTYGGSFVRSLERAMKEVHANVWSAQCRPMSLHQRQKMCHITPKLRFWLIEGTRRACSDFEQNETQMTTLHVAREEGYHGWDGHH
ncbi:hypothetical protein AJ79_01236 [Helicocarpus griseus UAMH5409]|uniref:Uncharacterized protein n=1 Tax=Helicocarpus griseus UAMH5409 TaxID=1447875 RepID=A0A2B7Y903_9EURO|nr:hypothetical protein AJ79_01236 [Helicocarpus griseus UAMH5409]